MLLRSMKNNTIHKETGPLIKEWAKFLQCDESANAVIVEAYSKRRPVILRGPFFEQTARTLAVD